MWGTLFNVLTVVCGSLVGLLIKRYLLNGKGRREWVQSLSDGIFKGLGLCVLGIGVSGAIKAAVNDQIRDALEGSYVTSPDAPLQLVKTLGSEQTFVIIFSMVIGVIIGYLLRLDHGLNRLGEKVEAISQAKEGQVAQGFVSASLLFCVGSMTIVGSLQSGLLGDHSMLYTKSILDLVSSIILSSTMGIGVLFSSVFVLVFQGSITLLAQWIAPYLTTEVITCMSGVGSLLIIGLALNILLDAKLKITNYLPAVLLPILLVPVSDWVSALFA
ncbi:MAG: DUF554 domain-containing protein [Clostridia bacterium]|nr:DUF554 domain-containing protein [Clostridia bacterium]